MDQFNNELVKELLDKNTGTSILEVNNHIHSPYSFSSFESVEQAVKLAKKEGIKVLGINDFFVTDAFESFDNQCGRNGIYPLFNIEFIGLHKEFQQKGMRVNDPKNPGRVYLSGKGLKKNFTLSPESKQKTDRMIELSQLQVQQMVERLNTHLISNSAPFALQFEQIKTRLAKNLVRERHIASALRLEIEKHFESENERKILYSKIFSENPVADISDKAKIEEEIRSRLLKSGGIAFVPEDENAFLSIEDISSIITEAGGILTYPVLLDDANGNYTDFEKDKNKLAQQLKSLGIHSVEFIPSRNSHEALKEYSEWFFNQGFLVLYGTEHNSPLLSPLKLNCRDTGSLDELLLEINYKSACIIAAHQFLIRNRLEGYIAADRKPLNANADKFIKLGNILIKNFIQ